MIRAGSGTCRLRPARRSAFLRQTPDRDSATAALPELGKNAVRRSWRPGPRVALAAFAAALRPGGSSVLVLLLGVLVVGVPAHGGDADDDRGVVTPNTADTEAANGAVEPAVAVAPMPTGPARPSVLLLDPPVGPRRPPPDDDLKAVRRAFRAQCRDLLRVSRTRSGARMAAALLEEAAATEKDPCLKWVLLEESIRLGSASGEPQRIESAVELAAEHFRIDAVRTELDALDDIPLRALEPNRAIGVAEAAERIAESAEAEERPRDRAAAWGLAAEAWKRAGDGPRAKAARAAAIRATTPRSDPVPD